MLKDRISSIEINADVRNMLKEYCERNNLVMYKFVSETIEKAINSEENGKDR